MTPFSKLPPATWIWTDADPDAPGQLGRFRLSFRAAASARWLGFADTFYTLTCNGEVVGVGPATGVHTQPRLTDWDLTPFLRPGGNVLAVEVWFDGRVPSVSDVDPWQAGLLGWLVTPETVLGTGPAWKARAAGRIVQAPMARRAFGGKRIVAADFRSEPADWAQPGFDDRGWNAATVVTAHPAPARPTLRASPLPPLTQTPLRPVALIDAGLARGGAPARTPDEVAERMWAQAHESLLRPALRFSVLSAEEREGTALGLAQAERAAAFGWPDPAAGFRGPLALPDRGADLYLCWDLGRQTSGNVRLEVACDGDLTIDLGYADHLERGRVNPTTQGHVFADRLIVGAGRQWVSLPLDRGFRYLQCTFSAPAVLHDLRVDEHLYPHDDAVRFRCSDATLNGVWELARATLHQCSLTSHVDNARRERQGWGGPDLYAQMHGFFAAFGDLRLSRKMLEDYLDFFTAEGFVPNWYPAIQPAVRWIPAHDLWFPLICRDYLRYADDRAFAPRLLAVSETVLGFYAQYQVHGLYGRAHDGACRWAEWNMNAAQQISTWENLLAAAGWRAVAEMRAAIEASSVSGAAPAGSGGFQALGTAAEAVTESERLVAAIAAQLWHVGHGALAQGTADDGRLLDFCAQVDNAFALLHGLLPPERREAAYRFCAGASGTWPTSRSGWQGYGQGERVRYDARKPVVVGTPFGSSLCAQVIHRRDPTEAVQYLRYNFGAMLDEGEGGLWEMWPIYIREQTAATCFSQGYGGHVAATLVGAMLGLTFSAPGGATLRWEPRDNGLAWVEGAVATPHGEVKVRCDAAGLHYTVPAGDQLLLVAGSREIPLHGPAAGTVS